jgi:hypothetical protein
MREQEAAASYADGFVQPGARYRDVMDYAAHDELVASPLE